jgi:hypothetical protein
VPPADITYAGSYDIPITLDDVWQVPIEDYVIGRCLAGPKGQEVPGATQLAIAHMQNFYMACDREDLVKAMISPNRNWPNPSPTKVS